MLDSLDDMANGGTVAVKDTSLGAELVELLALVSSSMDDLLLKLVGHDGGVSDKAAGAVAGTTFNDDWSKSSRSYDFSSDS